jgi:cupin fold WbuC family metalloprotein
MIDFSRQQKESSEVYLSTQEAFSLSPIDIQELKQIAHINPRRRVRFCTHSSSQETVHEMFIVHPQGAYVRPHKHLKKAESMLVIEGEVNYIIFDNCGNVEDIIDLGDYQSGKSFYQSIRTDLYHSLLIRSEWVVFLEVTKGPFEREDTVFAEWSPEDSDIKSIHQFSNNLMRLVP